MLRVLIRSRYESMNAMREDVVMCLVRDSERAASRLDSLASLILENAFSHKQNGVK